MWFTFKTSLKFTGNLKRDHAQSVMNTIGQGLQIQASQSSSTAGLLKSRANIT